MTTAVLTFAANEPRWREMLDAIVLADHLRAICVELRARGEAGAERRVASLNADIEALHVDRFAVALGLPRLMLRRDMADFARTQLELLGDRLAAPGREEAK